MNAHRFTGSLAHVRGGGCVIHTPFSSHPCPPPVRADTSDLQVGFHVVADPTPCWSGGHQSSCSLRTEDWPGGLLVRRQHQGSEGRRASPGGSVAGGWLSVPSSSVGPAVPPAQCPTAGMSPHLARPLASPPFVPPHPLLVPSHTCFLALSP